MSTYGELMNLDKKNKTQSIEQEVARQEKPILEKGHKHVEKTTVTRVRDISRSSSRENMRDLPTRDEVQEFSFHLRDELKLKVKVQAEVPYQWQEELEEVARQLKVKKLELYRFIFGEFLGKVKRIQKND